MRPLIALLVLLSLTAPFARADGIKAPQFTLSLTFTGLAVGDTCATIYGVSHLGLVERNRLLRGCFERGNYAPVWGLQILGTAAILAACHVLIHSDTRFGRTLGWTLLIAANVARGLIVLHNLRLNHQVQGR